MTESAFSRHGVPIRLTNERWAHIVEEHAELGNFRDEVLLAVSQAEAVYEGFSGELLASRRLETGYIMVVVYREVSSDDGFVITAFITSQADRLTRRPQVWPPKV